MADWMSDHMAATEIDPQMMWGDPDRMRSTCQRWVTQAPPAGAADDMDPSSGATPWSTGCAIT
jgi:hypothetical protein